MIKEFLERNKELLKKQFKTDSDKLITRKDLLNIDDEHLKNEIERLTNENKIDIDKLAFEINCFIYGDDIIPFADIEALDYD